jgi:predicted nucleotidyltransferase
MKSFIEEIKNDPRFIDRSSFDMQDELHQKFWIVKEKIVPKIRKRLIQIAEDFINDLDKSITIKDITMTGSLANYNWSQYSDIDLHIIVDFDEVDENTDLVRDFFNAKKSAWNQSHDIRIGGFEVEIYVQDENEPHVSTGVYSLSEDKWITEPKKEDVDIDWSDVEKKAESLMDQIDRVYDIHRDGKSKEAYEYALKLKDKIRRFRSTGLERAGQYSGENIAFKVLRRNGYMGKLISLKTSIYDKMMSMGSGVKIKLAEHVEKWKGYLKE